MTARLERGSKARLRPYRLRRIVAPTAGVLRRRKGSTTGWSVKR